MSGTPVVQRVLAAAVPALLVAGAVSAYAVGRSPGASPSTSSASAASAASGVSGGRGSLTQPLPGVGPSGSTPAVVASTTTSAPGTAASHSSVTTPGPATTVSPPATVPLTVPADPTPLPTVPATGQDPGQPAATQAGTYRYTITTSSGANGQGSTSGTMTEHVVTQSASGGVTVQQVTDSESSQQQTASASPAQGNNVEQVEFGPQGNLQLATDVDAAGQTIHCVWTPAVLELPSGLAVGKRWTLAGTCHVSVFGQSATISISGQGTVTGSEVVRVGSTAVPVWVISDAYTVVVHVPTFGVTVTLHHVATDRVSGRLGLIVEEDATDAFSMGSQSMTTASHQALQDVHPS